MIVEIIKNKGKPPTFVVRDDNHKTIFQKFRLGDKIADMTKAIGIEPCEGCEKRQAFLNGEDLSTNRTNATP